MKSKSIVLSDVRRKSFVFDLIPWVGQNTATTIYPFVYVPRTIYEELSKGTSDPYHVALLLHEQEHIKRIKLRGVLRWYVRYFLSRHFRFEEEIAATKPQFAYLKDHHCTVDLDRRANYLSGWLYLWSVGHPEASRRLQSLWDES